jgi:hypothetical protein
MALTSRWTLRFRFPAQPFSPRPWCAAALTLFVLVLALRGWVQWVGPLPGDRSLLVFAYRTAGRTRTLQFFAPLYNGAGTTLIAVLTVATAASVLYRRVGRRAAAGVVIASTVVLCTAVLKALWGPTPLWLHEGQAGVNYPSRAPRRPGRPLSRRRRERDRGRMGAGTLGGIDAARRPRRGGPHGISAARASTSPHTSRAAALRALRSAAHSIGLVLCRVRW